MRVQQWCAIGFLLTTISMAGAQTATSTVMTGTWATAPVQALAKATDAGDKTIRNIVHVSLGSTDTVSVQLTNEFGIEPLTVSAATIALRQTDNTVSTPVALSFQGQASIVIPPGKFVWSDAVHLPFPAMSDVAVSLFIPTQP
ncbi:MAG TPA: hypothetical protein VGE93_15260, partial [Bryobacteraceae bacterium]